MTKDTKGVTRLGSSSVVITAGTEEERERGPAEDHSATGSMCQ